MSIYLIEMIIVAALGGWGTFEAAGRLYYGPKLSALSTQVTKLTTDNAANQAVITGMQWEAQQRTKTAAAAVKAAQSSMDMHLDKAEHIAAQVATGDTQCDQIINFIGSQK